MMSVADQSNTVDHDSYHEEAWRVFEELSMKEISKKKKEQNKMFKIKRLQNLKQFLLKNETKFKTDIDKKLLGGNGPSERESPKASIFHGTSFLQQESSSSHLQASSRGISTSTTTSMANKA